MRRSTMFKVMMLGALVTGLLVAVTAVWADQSWSSYHWARTANPLTLSFGDNVADKWDGHLAIANADWNDSAVLNNTVDPGRTNPRKCSPDTGLVEICSSKYGFNGWLGIAGIWTYADDHIAKGYVKMNDSYFNTRTYNTPEWRQLVMCQEIGHIFGMGHQDEDFDNANLGTCMDYTDSPVSNQHPNQHDYDLFDGIYAHLNGYDSWVAAPAADDGSGGGNGKGNGNGKKGEAPGQGSGKWGKAIGVDGNGRADLFELDLGNGNKVITHVFWAN